MNERKTCLQALDSLIKELNIFICIDYSTHFFTVANLYVATYIFQYIYTYIPPKAFLLIPVAPQGMWTPSLLMSGSFFVSLLIRKF